MKSTHMNWKGEGHTVLKHLFPHLFLAHFCNNYNYLSNQRIALTPPPVSEFLLTPSLRQVHGKARGAQGSRGRQLLGGGEDAWVSLRAALQRLAWSSRVSAVASAGSQRADSEASARPARRRGGSHGVKGAGRSGVSSALGAGPALRAPGRSPLARLCRPRPAGSAELGPPPRRPPACSPSFGNPAPGRSSRRRAGPSAGAAPSREGAQLRRSGAAAAAPAVGCRAKLQPAPRAPGLRHLGPDRRRAGRGAAARTGPRHLSAS